jgi:hypothetical protein
MTPVAGLHVSMVQALPSLMPGIGVKTHPIAGSQVSVVQALLSLQTLGVPATQMPLEHILFSVQA